MLVLMPIEKQPWGGGSLKTLLLCISFKLMAAEHDAIVTDYCFSYPYHCLASYFLVRQVELKQNNNNLLPRPFRKFFTPEWFSC